MRLILVPQFPIKMRYQEWWYEVFPKRIGFYFNEVIRLGLPPEAFVGGPEGSFSPVKASIHFEMSQIEQYLALELREDDVLLLNDLSFPGLFASVLFHKKPKRCFAICHGTSKNRFDYFSKFRTSKCGVETATAKLFDSIIVASLYHEDKLGWKNITVLPFPVLDTYPPDWSSVRYGVVCVSRKTSQKVTKRLERAIEQETRKRIVRLNCFSWESYYSELSKFKVMLITSKEETFGYQVVDAVFSGCIPIAPNKYSYPELLPKQYLYNNEEEMVTLVWRAFAGQLLPLNRLENAHESDQFFPRLANLMLK